MNASLHVRPLRPEDAPAVAELAAAFADYLRGLGNTGEHLLTTEAIQRDGFGPRAAFAGLVAAGAKAPDDADGVGDAGAADFYTALGAHYVEDLDFMVIEVSPKRGITVTK
jgi:hypothetical protein